MYLDNNGKKEKKKSKYAIYMVYNNLGGGDKRLKTWAYQSFLEL